jgi:hypothetical protein
MTNEIWFIQPASRQLMNLPEIGAVITTPVGLALCRYFQLDYLVKRIVSKPDAYRDWAFDGCSGLPDEYMGLFTGCRWQDITYRCCLPHDLCYAYGEPGNTAERKQVDEAFYKDLVEKAGMQKWAAIAFLAAVRVGGAEQLGLSFTWAFAHQ